MKSILLKERIEDEYTIRKTTDSRKRYEELTQILMDPSIANDIQKMTQAFKEQASFRKGL